MEAKGYLESQLLTLFEDVKRGADIAPARVYRLEGCLQMLILLKQYSVEELIEWVQVSYKTVHGVELDVLFPPVTSDGIIPLPVRMPRAPVR